MFLPNDSFFRGGGEPPRRPKKDFIPSSKGYPATRDPQADNPTGVLPRDLSPAHEHKLRQRYAPARHF